MSPDDSTHPNKKKQVKSWYGKGINSVRRFNFSVFQLTYWRLTSLRLGACGNANINKDQVMVFNKMFKLFQ